MCVCVFVCMVCVCGTGLAAPDDPSQGGLRRVYAAQPPRLCQEDDRKEEVQLLKSVGLNIQDQQCEAFTFVL